MTAKQQLRRLVDELTDVLDNARVDDEAITPEGQAAVPVAREEIAGDGTIRLDGLRAQLR